MLVKAKTLKMQLKTSPLLLKLEIIRMFILSSLYNDFLIFYAGWVWKCPIVSGGVATPKQATYSVVNRF